MVLSWRSQLLELYLFRIIRIIRMLEEYLPVLPLIHSQDKQDTDSCFLFDSLDRYMVYYLLDHTRYLNIHRPVLRTLTYITAIQYQYHSP